MISRTLSFLQLLVWAAVVSMSSAFAPIMPAATVEINVASPLVTTTTTNQLQVGVLNYLQDDRSSLESSSTMMLSLKERPPPPTKDEIARKQLNFNLWFWGGGFVAPFLATIYYFGPKFWTK